MTFEELTSIYRNKPIDHISAQTVGNQVYIRFHLGNPCSQYIKKDSFFISPEEIKEIIAPGEDEEVPESVYEYFKSYTYYEKSYFYENYLLVIGGWVTISLNDDDDTLVTLIGGAHSGKENIDFVNKIFTGRHIVKIHPIVNNESGEIEQVSIELSNGMRISDYTSFLNQYSAAQIYLTSESNHIFYAFTKDGIIEKNME
jgi:hypothetical protein